MPGRYLKEEICTSPDIEALSWQEEVLFYRLIVRCDDFGRFWGDPDLVRAACFPLRLSRVHPAHVEQWLSGLEAVGVIVRYFEGPRQYLEMTGWDRHQRKRAARSKFPDPPQDGLFPAAVGRSPTSVRELRSSADKRGHPRMPSPSPSPSPLALAGGAAPSANGASKRAPDPLFEAIVDACGYDLAHLTSDARGRVNRATKQLREVGAEPKMIRGFAIQYRDHWPDVDLTPQAITNHWPAFMAGGLAEAARRGRR